MLTDREYVGGSISLPPARLPALPACCGLV
jgi:hypothetical protein